jgi:hypothetical protein
MNRTTNFFRLLTGISFTLAGYNTYNNANYKKVVAAREELLNQNDKINAEKMEESLDKINALNSKVDDSIALMENIKSSTASNPEQMEKLDKLTSMIEDISDRVSGKKLIDDQLFNINSYIENFNNYLSSLTIEQNIVLVNILGIIFIGLTMLSIVIIMFGNSLITFLKLEERFP